MNQIENVNRIYGNLKAHSIKCAKIIVGEFKDDRILVKCNARDVSAIKLLLTDEPAHVVKMFFLEAFWVRDIERTWI